MFYDLEAPLSFMQEVHDVLADDGIWVFEQSYMPTMLETNSYDTVCHEHLEFYALRQIKWMTDRVGFKILDVEFNDVNGGSFSVTAAKSSNYKRHVAPGSEHSGYKNMPMAWIHLRPTRNLPNGSLKQDITCLASLNWLGQKEKLWRLLAPQQRAMYYCNTAD